MEKVYLKAKLRKIMKEKNLSVTRFAKLVGIHQVSLSRLLHQKHSVSADSREKIEDALGFLKVYYLWNDIFTK